MAAGPSRSGMNGLDGYKDAATILTLMVMVVTNDD